MSRIKNGNERKGNCSGCSGCHLSGGGPAKERLVTRKLLRELAVMKRDDFRKEKHLWVEIFKLAWLIAKEFLDWLKHVFPFVS